MASTLIYDILYMIDIQNHTYYDRWAGYLGLVLTKSITGVEEKVEPVPEYQLV